MHENARFKDYTKRLREAFPVWTKIRKDPNAIGSQFLSVIGMTLDDVEWVLQYAYEQCYIGTTDIHQVDFVYRTRIPNTLTASMPYKFYAGSYVLNETQNVNQFLSPFERMNHYNELQFKNQYYIDFESKFAYVRDPFGANTEYPEGFIEIVVQDDNGKDIINERLTLYPHHVWNFFDEFGLLLDTPRLYKERNAEYKERILDVFRRPSDSTERGLLNGMARDLGLIHQYPWDNGGRDFQLPHSRIDTTSVMVDDVYFDNIEVKPTGEVVLKGMTAYEGQKRTIRYIAGITIHELHDETDKEFQNTLYRIDGTATPRLHYYVENIRNVVPIMWGQFKWDEGFWDSTDAAFSGYGFIPSLYDAKINGWKDYRPKEG